MSVRLADVGDAPAIAGMLHDFNREFDTPAPEVPWLTAHVQALLRDGAIEVVVAGEPPCAIGVLTFRPAIWADGEIAQLEEMYVRPERRGDGLGSAVLTRCIERAVERGCAELQINVDEVDAGARRFYERHGFINREPDADGIMLFYYRDLAE